jgi:hypothetical protein
MVIRAAWIVVSHGYGKREGWTGVVSSQTISDEMEFTSGYIG